MYIHFFIVLALTELALRTLATQKDPRLPYFYKNRTQMCNCNPHEQCSDNGICPSHTCKYPFIGHTCQHMGYEVWEPNPLDPSKLALPLDFDDSTCLSGPFNSGIISLDLKSPAHFIWVYILAFTAITVNPVLGLFFGNDKTNLNIDPYYMRINSKSLVMKVPQDVFYNSLSLANLPTDICSLYISRGRNLAISSDPDQSSVLAGLSMSKKQNARSAINGIEDRSFNPPGSTSCTHSQNPPAKSEWWRTRLKHDAVVNTVLIANRDQFQCRLRDFTLETFTSANKRSSEYVNAAVLTGLYEIPVSSRELVREVKLSVKNESTRSCPGMGILTLCAVEIYGEFRCPTDYYGPLCDIHCPHCIADFCDPDWGCTKCKGDWTGEWCNINVPTTTTTPSTTAKDVPTTTTTPSTTAKDIIEKADTDRPGQKAIKNCSKRYGPKCEWLCSKNCKGSGDCSRDTGHCLEGCKPGFQGGNCKDPCSNGTFGENCFQHCVNCKKSIIFNKPVCDPGTGECVLGCEVGYKGDRCDQNEKKRLFDTNKSNSGVGPTTHLFGLVLSHILIVLHIHLFLYP